MKATATMLEDAFLDLAGRMKTKGADKISRTENSAFFAGNDVNKPKGLLTYAAWTSADEYDQDKKEKIITLLAHPIRSLLADIKAFMIHLSKDYQVVFSALTQEISNQFKIKLIEKKRQI